MAQKLNNTELIIFKKLLMDNSMEVDSITNLCIQLGIFSEEELYQKLQEIKSEHLKMNNTDHNTPYLLDALITDMIAEMPLEDRVSTANLEESEIRILQLTLRRYVKHRLDQLNETGNEKLKKECIAVTGIKSLNDAEAASVILKELWKRLQETHRLRVVK
jgi:hypothetical protein